jgi:ribosome-associated protein
MLEITPRISIPDGEIELNAIRAQGAGGQNVNKVSTAIHLRFDINASSLPDEYKEKLTQLADKRITTDGVIVIKAQRFRSQDKNREDALSRLQSLIVTANTTAQRRIATKPTRGAKRKRVDEKSKRGELKILRGKIAE